jgi:hypothetical protein
MRVSPWPPKAAVAPPEDRAVQAVVVTGEAVVTVVVIVAAVTVVVVTVATEAVAVTVVVAPEAWVVRAEPAAPQEAQALRVMAEAVAWAAASGVARDMEEAIREAV